MSKEFKVLLECAYPINGELSQFRVIDTEGQMEGCERYVFEMYNPNTNSWKFQCSFPQEPNQECMYKHLDNNY